MIESDLMIASQRIDRDRFSIVLGAAALGLTLGRVLQFPARHVGLSVLGSELGIQLTAEWLMLALVVGLVAAGVHGMICLHPRCPDNNLHHTAVHTILPALTILAAGLHLSRIEDIQLWMLAMLGAILALGVTIAIEAASLEPAEDGESDAQLPVTVTIYLLAVSLFACVFRTRARALVIAPEVSLVGALLAIRLFWQPAERSGRAALYGGIVGFVLGQAAWALNYWKITTPSAAGLLLLFFYGAAGISRQSLSGNTSTRGVLQHAAVGLAAAALILALKG